MDYKITFEEKVVVPENEETNLEDVEIVRGHYGDIEVNEDGEKLNPILDKKIKSMNQVLLKNIFKNYV